MQLKMLSIARMLRREKNSRDQKNKNPNQRSTALKPFLSRSDLLRGDNTFTYKFPNDCRLFQDVDGFTKMINEIKNHFSENSSENILKLDLSDVKTFDAAAIVVILTLTNFLNGLGIKVIGKIPEDSNALDMLVESDFFSHVNISRNVVKKGKDIIYTSTRAGKKVVETKLNAQEIRKIVLHLTGSEDSYGPLYNVIGEIQGNSVEHANFDTLKKNWFMSVHYEDEKCLIILADIGNGIINTMGLKFRQNFKIFVQGQSDAETLLNLFKGHYQSSTREPNRNTGLPGIFDSVKNKQIGKIHVITNKVYLELAEETKLEISNNFPGTLYAIEMTKENIYHESK